LWRATMDWVCPINGSNAFQSRAAWPPACLIRPNNRAGRRVSSRASTHLVPVSSSSMS
jgi:hypothetical protein